MNGPAAGHPSGAAITDQEFALFQRLIYKIAGISLSDAKKVLLVGRLAKRLKHYGLPTFSQYYRMLATGQHPEELQVMVDLLTTNETYFFREPKHFDFLRQQALAARGRRLRRTHGASRGDGGQKAVGGAWAAKGRTATPRHRTGGGVGVMRGAGHRTSCGA